MEAPWCNEKVTSPGTIVTMVAIEDHHPISGVLQMVNGSHTLDLDMDVMKDLSTLEKYNEYIDYCHFLAKADVKKIYQHMPMAGDAIAWQGKSLYSDALPNMEKQPKRNSLIGIFEKVNIDNDRDSLIPIPNRNRLFLFK
jgi:ectoine hydroxylase-related dioxygenase (phytanoyl-CoA dioxygenase family)